LDNFVFINGQAFNTTVAVSESEQARGLMGVKWPPPVMCFPYKNAAVRKFWMKNTISPLDILFCRSNTIVSICKGEPLSSRLIGPDVGIDLVIELPVGSVEEYGISVGQSVKTSWSPEIAAKIIRFAV
jgi:uncharacterized protein